jgi:hypothetical protein
MSTMETRLLKECEAIAASVLFNYHKEGLIAPTEIWTSDDRTLLAQAYFEIAKREMEGLVLVEKDPHIVLRAVRYLARDAMPPHGRDTGWFCHGLAALVGLACPADSVGPGGEPFFADIRRGMEEAEKEA